MEIRSISKEHFPEIITIYQQGIDTGNATFETIVPAWEAWNEQKLPYCRLMAVDNDTILGWAALSKVSSRCVYEGVAEVSIYVSQDHRGKRVGEFLMKNLIEESETQGIWTLQSGMFPENEGTISLHKKMGFRVIGFREKIGKLEGVWRDNILMERRSKKVGVE